MSDILEEAKKEVDRWYGPGNYETPRNIVQRLIAEVERLRHEALPHPKILADRYQFLKEAVNSQYCKSGKQIDWSNDDVVWAVQKIDSLTKERDEYRKTIELAEEGLLGTDVQLAAKIKDLTVKLASAKADNEQLEKDWARCSEGWSKSQLDLKCLEESTVDKKAWDQLKAEKARLKERVGKPTLDVKSIQCDRCGETLVNIPKLRMYHTCNDPAQGSEKI